MHLPHAHQHQLRLLPARVKKDLSRLHDAHRLLHQYSVFAPPPGSTYLLVDPCEREERVMDGLLMIAMNKHREICSIQSSGGIMLLKEQVKSAGDPDSGLNQDL